MNRAAMRRVRHGFWLKWGLLGVVGNLTLLLAWYAANKLFVTFPAGETTNAHFLWMLLPLFPLYYGVEFLTALAYGTSYQYCWVVTKAIVLAFFPYCFLVGILVGVFIHVMRWDRPMQK